MPPAHERFDAGNATAGHVGLGLIEELQLVLLDGGAQLGGEGQTVRRVLVLLGRIDAELALIPLGHVHGDVGAPQQRARVGPMLGEDRNANAGADFHLMAVDDERLLERFEQPAGRHFGLVRVRSGQQHGELVAAQARGRVAFAKHALESHAQLAQEQIAKVVPERIVDFLEAIEVHHQQRQRRFVATGRQNGLAQAVVEQQTIGQPGQRVVDGLVLERRLGLLAFGDVAHADDEAQSFLAHLRDRHFDREHAFVSATAGRLVHAEPESGLRQPLTETGRRVPGEHRHQRTQVAADDFRGREAKHLFTRRIARLNHAAVVHGQDAFGDVVQHGPQVRFAFAERCFGNAALDNLTRQLLVQRLQRGDRLTALARKDRQRKAQDAQRHDEHARANQSELRVAAADKRAGQAQADVDRQRPG